MYKPERCLRIIASCLILHNICIDYNIEMEGELQNIEEDPDENNVAAPAEILQFQGRQAGVEARAELIRTRFT